MNQHAIVIADTTGVIQHWSAGAAALFGHAASDTVGYKLDIFIPHEYHEQHWRGFNAAMASGTAEGEGTFFDAPVLCRDGEIRMFRGQLHVLRDEGKQAIGAMAIFAAAA